jgi:hypothetical protein
MRKRHVGKKLRSTYMVMVSKVTLNYRYMSFSCIVITVTVAHLSPILAAIVALSPLLLL